MHPTASQSKLDSLMACAIRRWQDFFFSLSLPPFISRRYMILTETAFFFSFLSCFDPQAEVDPASVAMVGEPSQAAQVRFCSVLDA